MVTEADSLDSSSDIISSISPLSPLKLNIYYDTSIRGCAKKCPCRTWVQCHHYTDITEQQMRLRHKDNKIFEEIHDWYENFFKHNHGLPDGMYPNG